MPAWPPHGLLWPCRQNLDDKICWPLDQFFKVCREHKILAQLVVGPSLRLDEHLRQQLGNLIVTQRLAMLVNDVDRLPDLIDGAVGCETVNYYIEVSVNYLRLL